MEGDEGCGGGGSSQNGVALPACGGRQLFYVELRPGETTIVSWKRLIKEAKACGSTGEPSSATGVQDSRDEAQFALDGCFQGDKPTTRHSNSFVDMEKSEHISEPMLSSSSQPKKRRKNSSKAPGEMVDNYAPRKVVKMEARLNFSAGDSSCVVQSSSHCHYEAVKGEQDNHGILQSSSGSPMASTGKKAVDDSSNSDNLHSGMSNPDMSVFPEYSKETTGKYGCRTNQHQDSGNCVKEESKFVRHISKKNREKSASMQPNSGTIRSLPAASEPEFSKDLHMKTSTRLPDLNIPASPAQSTDGSSLRPKGTVLEKAIRELEKIVAESKPPNMYIQDGEDTSSMAIKRRLPPEIKQKLAKVARLAQSSQGKISEDLINRLMSILGHLVQLRTLKRNLREMVLLGLSAKQEKAGRLHQIKMELTELIKLQSVKKEEATDDFQDAPGSMYTMDSTVEDKICDFYDVYVQGMDEDKGSQLRKLYVEFAELWPSGQMDKHGIKNAISRAKKRRRVMPDQEKVKENRKKKIKVQESGADFLGQKIEEKITFPMLKEQIKQQQREFESRVKKLSAKSERESHKIA